MQDYSTRPPCGHQPLSLYNIGGGIQFASFSWLYDRIFEVIEADNNMLKERAYHLRYQVYCCENKMKDNGDNHAKIEMDSFDKYARHALLVKKGQTEPLGTARVIFPNHSEPENSFPMQKECHSPRLSDAAMIRRTCQISRLCVSKDLRSRDRDNHLLPDIYYQDKKARFHKIGETIARRVIPFAPIGLIHNCIEMAVTHGCDRAILMIEKEVIDVFERLGIICEHIGEPVGTRRPIMIDFLTTMNNLKLNQPAVWEVLSNHGKLHKRITRLRHQLEFGNY